MGSPVRAAANRPTTKFSYIISLHDAGSLQEAWHKSGPVGQQTFQCGLEVTGISASMMPNSVL
jgi:hypothetical protein